MLIGWFPLGTFRPVLGCPLTRSAFALPGGRPVSINVAACGMDSQYRFLGSLIRKDADFGDGTEFGLRAVEEKPHSGQDTHFVLH